jgi:hypothetical protein
VLRRLGRQPWTWITTSGWIALITLGAIYMGHIFKSGDLYYRSLRLVDESDGQTVATRDVACIYSPRTTTYTIDTDPESWWQPVSIDQYGYSRGGIKTDLNYLQTYRGNTPGPMLINVWNLRFIEGEQIATAGEAGVIEAKISAPGNMSILGTIKNRGTMPLRDVTIRTKSKMCVLEGNIAPGQTVTLKEELKPTNTIDYESNGYYYNENYQRTSDGAIRYDNAADLSLSRSRRIERLFTERSETAEIFARVDGMEAPNPLHEPGAREDHRQIIRALVTLQPGTP